MKNRETHRCFFFFFFFPIFSEQVHQYLYKIIQKDKNLSQDDCALILNSYIGHVSSSGYCSIALWSVQITLSGKSKLWTRGRKRRRHAYNNCGRSLIQPLSNKWTGRSSPRLILLVKYLKMHARHKSRHNLTADQVLLTRIRC